MAVIVASLGYFVDIFDLILFGVVRNDSLKELGILAADIKDKGTFLLNMQMAGMLVGGMLWGILGDKKGRLSVLFGSIFLYSIANILNGFVTGITDYAILRFIAGVGLAGELGAGITLVTESMHREKRGYGTMLIVVVGALGAVLAALIGNRYGWRNAYFIGGGLGLALLLLRVGTLESGMYKAVKETEIRRGDFLSLFTSWSRFKRYLNCILIGLPVWFTISVLIINVQEFAPLLGITEKVTSGDAIMYAYIGLSVGDLISGLLSQLWRSRKKVVLLYIALNFIFVLLYLYIDKYIEHPGSGIFYALCFALGAATGFWALFVTIAAEQFGTNLRATVTTTVPNFVRGAVVPITSFWLLLSNLSVSYGKLGIITSALIVGTVCVVLAVVSVLSVSESFSKDLNYVEEL
jgi:MFS transporter, putative metabolite:H+ symporter